MKLLLAGLHGTKFALACSSLASFITLALLTNALTYPSRAANNPNITFLVIMFLVILYGQLMYRLGKP